MLLNDGLATMAVGMGTVFSFLIVLWAVVAFLGKNDNIVICN